MFAIGHPSVRYNHPHSARNSALEAHVDAYDVEFALGSAPTLPTAGELDLLDPDSIGLVTRSGFIS